MNTETKESRGDGKLSALHDRHLLSLVLDYLDIASVDAFAESASCGILRQLMWQSFGAVTCGKKRFLKVLRILCDKYRGRFTELLPALRQLLPQLHTICMDLSFDAFSVQDLDALNSEVRSGTFRSLQSFKIRMLEALQDSMSIKFLRSCSHMFASQPLHLLQEVSIEASVTSGLNHDVDFLPQLRENCPHLERLDVFTVLSARDCGYFLSPCSVWPSLRSIELFSLITRLEHYSFDEFEDEQLQQLLDDVSLLPTDFERVVAVVWKNVTIDKFPALRHLRFNAYSAEQLLVIFDILVRYLNAPQRPAAMRNFIGQQLLELELDVVELTHGEQQLETQQGWSRLMHDAAKRLRQSSANSLPTRGGTNRNNERVIGAGQFVNDIELTDLVLFPLLQRLDLNQRLCSPHMMLLFGNTAIDPESALQVAISSGRDDEALCRFLSDWISPHRWRLRSLLLPPRRYFPAGLSSQSMYSEQRHAPWMSTIQNEYSADASRCGHLVRSEVAEAYSFPNFVNFTPHHHLIRDIFGDGVDFGDTDGIAFSSEDSDQPSKSKVDLAVYVCITMGHLQSLEEIGVALSFFNTSSTVHLISEMLKYLPRLRRMMIYLPEDRTDFGLYSLRHDCSSRTLHQKCCALMKSVVQSLRDAIAMDEHLAKLTKVVFHAATMKMYNALKNFDPSSMTMESSPATDMSMKVGWSSNSSSGRLSVTGNSSCGSASVVSGVQYGSEPFYDCACDTHLVFDSMSCLIGCCKETKRNRINDL